MDVVLDTKRNRGYYTVERRYESYVWVARTISHKWEQRMSGILFLPREHKANVYYSFYYITKKLMTAFLVIFRRFPTTFQRFPKIFQNCSKGQTNVPGHFPRISENSRRCPKISEDCRRLSRKTRRCFDDTPTILSTIYLWDKLGISEIIDIFTCAREDIISSHVRISYCFYEIVTTHYTTDFYIIIANI